MIRLIILLVVLGAVATSVGLFVKRYNDGQAAIADRATLCKAHDIKPCSAKQVEQHASAQVKRIGELELANATTTASAQNLAGKLLHALAQNERVRVAGVVAIAQAKRAAEDAQRTLEQFTLRFANRKPTCDAALRTMQAACPELEGY